MTNGIFITATDTGVGKTIVSAMIIRALVLKGIKTGVMKPFETGCQRLDNNLIPSDGMFLRSMAEMDDHIDNVTPVRFELPLAPFTASRIEKKSVDMERFFNSFEYLCKKYDFVVVEGAGGILVPITREEGVSDPPVVYMSDIIKKLKLPLIVVSRPTLGTINHTLLTLKYALNEGLRVIGVIINYSNPPGVDISESTNPEIIAELSPVPVLGILPHLTSLDKKNLDRIVSTDCKGILDSIISKITDINPKNAIRDSL